MTTQDQFITAVRSRVANGIPGNIVRPMVDIPNDPIEYAVDLADVHHSFVMSAEAVDAEIVGAPAESISQILTKAIEDIEPNLVAVSADQECVGVEEYLTELGIAVAPRNDIDALASADLGITGSVAGIALTGSVVVDSRRAKGRLVSLLPAVHLALVAVDRIVGTPGDLLRNIPRWFPQGLPSNLVFITGPSRSADIELQITKGVHGPQRLLIALR